MKIRFAASALVLLSIAGCGGPTAEPVPSSLDQDATALDGEEVNPQLFSGEATKKFSTKVESPREGEHLRVRGTCAESFILIKFTGADFEKEFQWPCDPAAQNLNSNGVSLAYYLPDEIADVGQVKMSVTAYRGLRSEGEIESANAAGSEDVSDFWNRATENTDWTVTLSTSEIPK